MRRGEESGAYAGGVPTTAIPAEERQINLLLALRATRTGLTAAQIIRDISGYDPAGGATAARMFERDKEALRELGIDILTEGPADAVRYRIEEDDYALPAIHLDSAQAGAIALAASAWSDGALPAAARRALTKLRAVAETGSSALPDLTVDLAGHEIPLTLLTAIEDRRAVTFDYASSSPGSSGPRGPVGSSPIGSPVSRVPGTSTPGTRTPAGPADSASRASSAPSPPSALRAPSSHRPRRPRAQDRAARRAARACPRPQGPSTRCPARRRAR
ncbi:hypothetical protein ADENT20671_2455 [Actinomyces denticolens]|nr:hypothetical protein ADENT20671_2455 [Actinomyces denticolens]